MKKILIVDDNKDLQYTLTNILKNEGYRIFNAEDEKKTLEIIETKYPDLVLLDIRLPDADGLEILKEIKKIDENVIVIMLTAYGDTKNVVRAMKQGAYDFITKPFDNQELVLVVRKALHTQFLDKEVKRLKKIVDEKTAVGKMIGESAGIKHLLKQIMIVAPTNMTVIIQGGSGTGKELAAQTIHKASLRNEKPFIVIDCGAIPDTLVESELFGHEKGAFTGADARKEGKFELADGGTLFLDEIGNLPLFAQAKLLRVIQEKKLQHIGGKTDITINVRILTASNIDLHEAVIKGMFREDLYHRLNEFVIELPFLKDRTDDIPLLTKHFIEEANKEFDKNVKGLTKKAFTHLVDYKWPGNVRELKNVIKRAVLIAESEKITEAELSLNNKTENNIIVGELNNGKKYDEMLGDFEYNLIKNALSKTNGNKIKAAEMLHINKKTFYRKLKNYNIK